VTIRRLPVAAVLTILAVALAGPARPAHAARAERLELRRLQLELDGPPVTILPADLTGDGRRDLIIVTAFTRWGEISSFRSEQVEGRVWEVVEVSPTLIDRREIQLYRARPDGGYEAAAPPQPLPFSVLALADGPPGHPALALTSEGLAGLRFEPGAEGGPLVLAPLRDLPPVMAGIRTLLPGYDFTRDLDGDGSPEVLFPAAEGLQILTQGTGGLEPLGPALPLPGDESGRDGVVWRRYPLPRLLDVDGDGRLDLVFTYRAGRRRLVRFDYPLDANALSVRLGLGGGRFSEPVSLHPVPPVLDDPGAITPAQALRLLRRQQALEGTFARLADIDGDGRVELATYEEIETPDAGFRKEMKEAKRPTFTWRIYRLGPNLRVEPEPWRTFEMPGYPFIFDWLAPGQGGFLDLDGDGRLDLVTADLDYSMWQIPNILVARTIGVGLLFHLNLQQSPGQFTPVPGKPLRGKLKIDLKPIRLLEFAQFAGDFDGDGRTDFVRLGGGRNVDIHRGRPDGRYPRKPDAVMRLERSPDDTGLVKLQDLDGDGRSDLLVMTVLDPDEEGESRPTRLDIYMPEAAP
jgi:hypothetical protein